MMFKSQKLFIVILITILGVESANTQSSSICPAPLAIAPCTCTSLLNETKVICSYLFQSSDIDQSNIDHTFDLLRQVNSPSKVVLDRFEIYSKNMEQLSLTPLFHTKIKSLDITNLRIMNRIHANGSRVNGTSTITTKADEGSIDVTELRIRGTSLRNSGIETIFPYFSSNMTILALRFDDLSSTKFNVRDDIDDGAVEFLPGFSRLTKLRELYLGYFTQPALIEGGQFKRNKNLQLIDLSNSKNLSLGPAAFVIDPPEHFNDDEFLLIDLTGNNLTDSSFTSLEHVSLFERTNRATTIDLSFNSLESLASNHFQGFLTENENNTIYASANNFFCGDQRMKWLQDGRLQFQIQVSGVFCRNDPLGGTIFNTNLTAI